LKIQGKEKLRAHFAENDVHYAALRDVVTPLLGQGAADHFVEIDLAGDEDDDDGISSLLAASGVEDNDSGFEDDDSGVDE